LIQSIPFHPNSLRSILILSTHLVLVFTVVSFLPRTSYMHSSSSHSCYMPCPSHPPWLAHFNYALRRVQVMKLLIL
jgi:hypothetical protein